MRNPTRRGFRRSFAPATLVFVAGSLLAAGVIAPGPTWLYVLLALVIVVLGCLVNRSTAQLLVGFLGTAFPSVDWILKLSGRRKAFAEVIDNMNRILADLGQRRPKKEDLEQLAQSPPHRAEDDVNACAIAFAERLDDDLSGESPSSLLARLTQTFSALRSPARPLMADVYELFYRERHGPPIHGLFGRLNSEQQLRVARILATSNNFPALAENEDRVELVGWVLGRLRGEFSIEAATSELRALSDVWHLLHGYVEYLGAEGIAADLDLGRLRKKIEEISGGQLASDFGAVAHVILTTMGRELIRSWLPLVSLVKPQEDTQATEPTQAETDALVAGLTDVSAGIYTAETISPEHPLLAELALETARASKEKNLAKPMLLAYLWARSRPDRPDQPSLTTPATLSELAEGWRSWADSLSAAAGPGFRRELEAVLTSNLRRQIWPTYLPVQQAVAESVLESRKFLDEFEKLAASGHKDDKWRADLENLASRISAVAERSLDPRALNQLDEPALIETTRLAAADYLRGLVPPQDGATPPETSIDVQRRLESFTDELRDEARLRDHLEGYDSVFETLALFRDRADDLSRQLDDLVCLLKAEAAGGSAYLITFDQVTGGIAKVIDQLKPKYGFKNYTRYTRLGRLRPGDTFESFYARFEADLEKRLETAFGDAAKVLRDCDREQLEDAKRRFHRTLEAVVEPLEKPAEAEVSIPAEMPRQRHAWKYRRFKDLPGAPFDAFFARAWADLERQLLEHFPWVPSETRHAAVNRWLELARTAAVWDRIEITVQQVSLFHRHDFAMDARHDLGPRLGKSYSKVFRVPPSSALVETAIVPPRFEQPRPGRELRSPAVEEARAS